MTKVKQEILHSGNEKVQRTLDDPIVAPDAESHGDEEIRGNANRLAVESPVGTANFCENRILFYKSPDQICR